MIQSSQTVTPDRSTPPDGPAGMPASAAGTSIGARGENLAIRVPTYNCAELLRETLDSLIAQGDQLAEAAIEVIDDCSPQDDPEAVVREYGDPRITFHRHPQNVGPIANFNACIDRALATSRRWIHILHGDDYVLPGFYQSVRRLQESDPEAQAVFVRSVLGGTDNVWTSVSVRLGEAFEGRYAYDPLAWGVCPIQFAGAVFSRDAVETVGRFDEQFCHVADWDMWRRLARDVPVAYSNACLTYYRVFPGNHSSGLKRKAINVAESLAELERVEADLARLGPVTHAQRVALYTGQYHRAKAQTENYLDDPEAFTANLRMLKAFPREVVKRHHLLRLRIAHWRARRRGATSAAAATTTAQQ